MEYRSCCNSKDSIDIFGEGADYAVVIEIDKQDRINLSLKDNVSSGEVEQLPIKESVLDPKEVDSQETKKVANDIEVPVKPKQSEKHYQTNLLDGLNDLTGENN